MYSLRLEHQFLYQSPKGAGGGEDQRLLFCRAFLGVLFGVLLLGERPGLQFYLGLAIMIAATVLMVKDTITLQHTHEHSHTHTHEHAHGSLVHTHEHSHIHSHTHVHGEEEAVHGHTHGTIEGHNHSHTEQ